MWVYEEQNKRDTYLMRIRKQVGIGRKSKERMTVVRDSKLCELTANAFW